MELPRGSLFDYFRFGLYRTRVLISPSTIKDSSAMFAAWSFPTKSDWRIIRKYMLGKRNLKYTNMAILILITWGSRASKQDLDNTVLLSGAT